MVAFCSSLLFVFMFIVNLFLFWSLLRPFLVTMSFFAGYFLASFLLLFAFPTLFYFIFLRTCCSWFDWFGSVYLVTTADS